MSTQVQYRRGSNVQVAAFTGALGEIVVDTTNKVLVVNDGVTVGGFPQVGLTATQTLTNKIYNGTSVSVTGNITASGATINGDLTVTGNATLSGNIVGDVIQNGNTRIEIQTTNGNANITVSGTSNVAVFTPTGLNLTGTISATGNITGNYFIGNGSQLTGIDATAIQNGTANVRTFLNGNVTTSAGGTANVLNVTSTGAIITGDLSVTGNATLSGNILGDRIQNGTTIIDIQVANGNANVSVGGTSNVAVFANTGLFVTGVNSVSGNITGGNVLTAGLISATGNITGGNILGGANVNATTHTGTTVSVTANITGGNVLTAGLISATGNITGNFIFGNGSQLTGIDATSIQSGTSNVRVVSSGGNVATGIGGTANVVVVATTGQFVTGVNSVSGNVDAGNLRTAGLISATGNATAGNILTAGIMSSTGNGIHGNVLTGGLISATSNITGGNILFGAGIVSGTGNVFATNLTGTLQTAAQTNITSVGTLGSLTVTANVSGGNLLTGGLISATGAITGAALTGTSLTVSTGNITAGNLLLSGAIVDSAQLDIQTSANNANIALAPNGTGLVTVSTQLSAVGNVTGGNIRTAGLISATGQVTGSQFNGSGAGLTSIPNGALTNSSITVNGTAIALGSSGTVTANTPNSLTLSNAGTGSASGTTFNGSAAVTISHNSIGAAPQAGNSSIVTVGALNSGSITSGFGAIDIGTDTVTCGGIINANGNGVGNIGSASLYFNTVFAKATSAQYADLAEMYAADAAYEPGTVVCFGGTQEVEISQSSHSISVAGVVSTNPSYIMNAGQSGSHVVAVALTGRVPTKVVGTIKKGDRIVSSHISGVATALDPSKYEPGCIIGKALQSHEAMLDANGNEIPGIIEVVVGRV